MKTAAPVVVVGGGPAGLMAAETLAASGQAVHLYEAGPRTGRKFLLAGSSGLNLTHSEPLEQFLTRYGPRQTVIRRWLTAFGPQEIRAWAQGLGVPTLVGSSGKVFPQGMSAAPLLRAWLRRLEALGVRFFLRHRWTSWEADGSLRFATPDGPRKVQASAVLLALGGASWPQLGSDGGWVPRLAARGVPIAPLRPANCGFEAAWSDHFRQRFAGAPLKTVTLALPWTDFRQRGECVVTAYGLEGTLIYAASAAIRDRIAAHGPVYVTFDLLPDVPLETLRARLAQPRGKRSLSEHLRRRARLDGLKRGLLREARPELHTLPPDELAAAIKALPLRLQRPRPLEEAISTAGGIRLEALTPDLMLKTQPGLFFAGEMLDWEAPTGGYLLTACLASGVTAARGILRYLNGNPPPPQGGPRP